MRQFNVIPVLNGFIVSIGCQTLVFTSNESLEQAIHDYITSPSETAERFLRHSLHSELTPDIENVVPVCNSGNRDADERVSPPSVISND